MPIKRIKSKHRAHRITPDAIAAFEAGDRMALHRALDLKPHMESPLDCEGECPWPAGTGGADSWPLVADLREELEAASDAS